MPTPITLTQFGWLHERGWWRTRKVLWVLELDHAHAVVGRVNEPGHPGEPDIGNTVLGLESWNVVVFDLHAAVAQFADLCPHIGDAKGSLRLLVLGPHDPVTDQQTARPGRSFRQGLTLLSVPAHLNDEGRD